MTIPIQHTHTVPPDQDGTAEQIAEILAATTTLAGAVAGIAFLLAPLGITKEAIEAALKVTSGSALVPYARLRRAGIGPDHTIAISLARAAAKRERFYRSAFVMALSGRLQRALDAGKTVQQAIEAEKPNYDRHNAARRKRLDAAAQVGLAAQQFGPVLGWYRSPESNSEAECRIADGNNFRADTPPVIGYPGSVHPRCACEPGPPHLGAGMVDDALGGFVRLVPRKISPVRSRRRKAG